MQCCVPDEVLEGYKEGLLIEGKIFSCVPQRISRNKTTLPNYHGSCLLQLPRERTEWQNEAIGEWSDSLWVRCGGIYYVDLSKHHRYSFFTHTPSLSKKNESELMRQSYSTLKIENWGHKKQGWIEKKLPAPFVCELPGSQREEGVKWPLLGWQCQPGSKSMLLWT